MHLDIIEGLYENGSELKDQNKQVLEKIVVANGGSRWQKVPADRACYVICSRTNCKYFQSNPGSRADLFFASS